MLDHGVPSVSLSYYTAEHSISNWGKTIQPIGETAGKIWSLLNENGEASLSQLKRGVEADPNLILQAIGWLAVSGNQKGTRFGPGGFLIKWEETCLSPEQLV
jgi:hypothetical protein